MKWTTTLPYTRTTINSRFCQATNELPSDMQRLVWEKS